ncbi:PREDICTED: mesoderm posterior protein 1 [Odobenus rosmarus divergens]|uniref:Mesoderm posterior protein 1 n=1 Tax=Odobenus rosmarus divergens TaxID=9708 RepID=A0A2U3VSS9_ODORO|nr:PREDICTED: mesoderm posterior protein 1 [Odobenus rosmarus divergens]
MSPLRLQNLEGGKESFGVCGDVVCGEPRTTEGHDPGGSGGPGVVGVLQAEVRPSWQRDEVGAQPRAPGVGSAAGAAASWGSPPACPGALAAPEPRDPPVLYDEAACPESLAVELSPSSPLFPGDVLALLETWMPLSPLEWPPA